MQKYIHTMLKVLLSLLMLMPIIGALGVFPAPTADLYNTPQAFAFIEAFMNSGYLNPLMGMVFAIALVLLWTKREALSVILILPITVNIVAFHLFLDGGLFTPGSIMADLLVILNFYFLWNNRSVYQMLLKKR